MEARLTPGGDARRPSHAVRRARGRAVLQVVLGLAGIGALAALVHHVGAPVLLAVLRRAASLLPLVLLLEVARVGCDTRATSTLCPPGTVPIAELFRIHVVSYPIAALMPAGKTTAEAVKAAMLSSRLGTPRAAAIAAMSQALSLIAAGLLSLIAAISLVSTDGASLLALGVFLHFVCSVGSGLALTLAARRRALGAWLARRFARAGQATQAFQDALHELPRVPPRTLAALVANRALQAAQYAVLLAAVGSSTGPSRALVAYGVGAVGTAFGDLIPAQMGATDSAFTIAAPTLGLTASAAVAVSVLVHVVQASGALTGIVTALVWRRRRPAAEPAADAPPPTHDPAHVP